MSITPTIAFFIESVAETYADRPVARTDSRHLSYASWVRAARNLAAHFRSAGAMQQRIAVCIPNSFEFLIAMLAAWMSDAVCVPVSSILAAEREALRPLLDYVQPLITLVSAGTSSEVERQELAAGGNAGIVFEIHEDGSFERVLPGTMYFSTGGLKSDASQRTTDAIRTDAGLQAHDPGDILILYSSGTTAAPKGAIHTCDSVLHHVKQHISLMSYAPEDSSLVCMQMGRAFCLTSQVLPAVLSGATLLLHRSFNPKEVARAIYSDEVSLLYGYPDYFHKLVDQPDDNTSSRLRAGVAGGEMCTKATIRAFNARFSAPLIQSAGMIETLAYSLNTSANPAKFGAAGQVINGVDLSIMPHSTHSADEHGEIVVTSPSLMKGYVGFEPIERVNFRTGDAGSLDEDGYLWLHGKLPLSPKYRQRQAIKEALYSCSLVSEAAVVELHPDHRLVA